MSIHKTIKELIQFYVQINYEKYLNDNNLKYIPDNNIKNIVNSFYDGPKRKEHIKSFVVNGIKKLNKSTNEKININLIENMLTEILEDSELAKNRVIKEIQLYQNQQHK